MMGCPDCQRLTSGDCGQHTMPRAGSSQHRLRLVIEEMRCAIEVADRCKLIVADRHQITAWADELEACATRLYEPSLFEDGDHD